MCIRRVLCISRVRTNSSVLALFAASSSPYASVSCVFAKKREGDCVRRMLRCERGQDRARSIRRELNFHLLKGNVSISRIPHSRIQHADVSGYIAFPNEARLVRHYPKLATTRVRASRKTPSIRRQAEPLSSARDTESHYRRSHRPAYPPLRAHVKFADEGRQCASLVSRAGIERKRASWRIANFPSASPRDSKFRGISNFTGSASRVLLLSLLFCWRRDRQAVELDL
jgi:hypothetical protein